MKKCPTCKENKDSTEFSRNITRKDGLHWQCRLCKKESDKLTRIRAKQKGIEARKKKVDALKIKARNEARLEFKAHNYKCAVILCTNIANELHHVDYNYALDVIPLCRQHHEKEHHKE